MHYGNIKNCDIANGIGVRISIFVSGCTNRCKNCFQPETWDFEYGEEFTDDTIKTILEMLEPSFITGLTILGGEPFEPANQEEVLKLIKNVRIKFPNKNIWMFTGFVYEMLCDQKSYPHTEYTSEILKNIDVLVDGRFEEDKKDITLKFRGSSNQRIINVPKTIENSKIVLENL